MYQDYDDAVGSGSAASDLVVLNNTSVAVLDASGAVAATFNGGAPLRLATSNGILSTNHLAVAAADDDTILTAINNGGRNQVTVSKITTTGAAVA